MNRINSRTMVVGSMRGVMLGACLAMLGTLPLVALPKYVFSGIDVFALMAVPFFILTAELMTGGALSDVLLRFASQFVGRKRFWQVAVHASRAADFDDVVSR